tara:strand:+ start:184 stop:363 length:180 start_codon:yes stop_codon:yes gene_type:complete
MIIFNYPIHRKYTNIIYKILIVVISVIVFVLLVSCSKIDFDPTTTSFKYLIQKESKWKQ